MGRTWRSLKLGMKSLLLHKLRSGLTVLGIVFGVAAVISMLAVGEGSSRKAQRQFADMGATNIIIRSVKPPEETQAGGGRRPSLLTYGLTYSDYERLLATVPTIKRALPIREIRSLEARIVGTTHEFADFTRLTIDKGRFLTPSDDERFENFAVLAAETAKVLFPYENPLEKSVKLGSDYYTVIGVTRPRTATAGIGSSLAAEDFNKDVYIPLNTCRLRFGEKIIDSRPGSFSIEETQLSQITLQVHAIEEVRRTDPIIRATIEPKHPKMDVAFVVPYDLLMQAQATARQFSIILGTIASISLLVGGIGIMNIMLATVTERTREIGIRRALGAKRKDITQQFLIETIVLSGVGGVLGVCIGIGIPEILRYFAKDQEPVVTLQSVLLAFGISVGIGILFGLYPARRAAMMDPIEALRHE